MSQKQIIDAAMRTARATGGKVHKGAIHSTVAGRTDHLPMHVASGSYVIPADIISAMGEGNSMAGFKVAKDIFSRDNTDITKGTPYGESGLPYDASEPQKAGGGGLSFGSSTPAASASKAPLSMGTSTTRIATPATAVRPAVISKAVAPASTVNRAAAPVAATSNSTATDRSRAAVAAPSGQADRYTGLWDMINGGGKGRGYTGLGDMFDGGGMGASASGVSPASNAPVDPKAYDQTSGINRYGPAFLSLINPMFGAIAKGFQRNNEGQTGFQRFGENYADGGATDGVPIVAAGGEYVIPPEDVVHIGGGDMDHGHKVLDAFVKKMRQKTIKTLQGLPGPKRD
jgi:hypothetical protein